MAERARPGRRPLIDWQKAFLFYAGLPPEQRRYRAVAEQFSVSVRTVEKRARLDRWQERLRRVRAEAEREADQELARSWAKRIAEILQLADASLVTYAQRLRSGNARMTPSDFIGVSKLLLQLHDQPDGQVELLASSPEWIELRARILAALEAVPEARTILTEILDHTDDP